MTTRLRHPWRFVLTALLLGTLLSRTLVWVALFFSWSFFDDLEPFLVGSIWVASSAAVSASFALASACVAWLLRRHIVAAHGRNALLLSACGTWLGGALYTLFLLTFSLCTELAYGPVTNEDAGSLEPTFVVAVLLAGPLVGACFASLFLPVTLPFCWISIRILRRVSGGLEASRESPEFSAA